MTWQPPGPRPRPDTRFGPNRPKPRGYWYREYVDDLYDPKWRTIARKSGAELVQVLAVVSALRNAAAKTRKHGDIGDFSFEECASGLNLTPDMVTGIARALLETNWLDQHYLVSWTEDQPDQQDPTAADRQRNKRAREKALRAAALGHATPDQLAILSKPQLEALARLRTLTTSRVTAPTPEATTTFVRATPIEDTHEARAFAAVSNENEARRWLFVDDRTVLGYGPASKIVADKLGQTRMNADLTLRRWVQELAGDVVTLAEIISSAEQQALNGQGFEHVVRQRIEAVVKENTSGPSLPFGPMVVGGRG